MISPVRTSLVAAVTLLLGGCVNDGHIEGGDAEPQAITCGRVRTATIDRGAQLDGVKPGEDIGLFVEYLGAGDWRIFASCDVEQSGRNCTWDVIVTSAAPLSDDQGEELESSDDWVEPYRGGLRFLAYTESDIDAFRFHTTPGETVQVDAYIDEYCEPRLTYWVGDGAVHEGAPSNPMRLEPSAP